ncbi:cell division protein [gamma proteobacterium HTCC5015]|nr:cell division protein [gamma proteobacterium HTCC5015]
MALFQRRKVELKTQLSSYATHHLRVFVSSLGRLYQFPGPSAMTVAVIAIALALPTGFYVALKNAQRLSGGWDGATKISLYLAPHVSEQQGLNLSNRLKPHRQIESLRYISQSEALNEFADRSGFGDALNALDNNPLPAVIVITPLIDKEDPQALDRFRHEMERLPEVDIVQLDMQWVKRLLGIMSMVQRGLLVIASLLGVAVILVIGNTIRLDIQNRAREIRVQKLIGATNTFVRRPFLYTGFWYGLFGGIAAWLLVSIGLAFLAGPTSRLAGLYQSNFSLSYLSFGGGLTLLLLSIALGYFGSWLAVGRHLKEIEPGQ